MKTLDREFLSIIKFLPLMIWVITPWSVPFSILVGLALGQEILYPQLEISVELARFIGGISGMMFCLLTQKPVKKFLKWDEFTNKDGD